MKKWKNPFKQISQSTSSVVNPYLSGESGKRLHSDRYMNLAISVRNWQLAFLASIIAVIVMAICLVSLARESKVQPFVVETNQGMPYAIKQMDTLALQDTKLINFALDQFIINARSVISDAAAEKTLLNKVYAFSADETLRYLREYYDKNNPFEKAVRATRSVNIINALQVSDNTWEISWDETERQAETGNVMSVTRWVAQLTYKFGDVTPKFINDNPFGLYITHLTWAQSQL